MSQSLERAVRFLTGKENIEYVSISDLQKLADENPFFPVTQFLLSKKLKAGNHIDSLPQLQKTVLYFSNPFWLHFQLDTEHLQVLSEKDHFDLESQILTKEQAASSEEEQTETATAKISVAENVESAKKIVNQPEEEMAAITREPDIATELFLNAEAIAYNNNLSENDNFYNAENTEVLEETVGASEEANQVTGFFLNKPETTAPENTNQSLLADNNFSNNNLAEYNKEAEEQDEHEKMFQNIKAMLDATSEEADADTDNSVIPIDPYYTIDYFAAQGIKLDLDPNPKDDLGKHLKKFTQWLKQMKKLGPEDAAEIISRRETEADIQKIADSSNMVREVVTEAMASVLEKQGKKEKAIELYNKLSFLNQDKSAYFAVKIKNLKGS